MAPKRSIDLTMILVPVLLLAVLVMLQILSNRYILRVDLTAKSLYSLSQKSRQILDGLDGSDLKATAFFARDDAGREQARDILNQYRNGYSSFSFEIVDPAKNPRLVEQYQVGSNGTIVLEFKGRETKVVSQDEEAITNGIYRLSSTAEAKLYFLRGHGEKSPNGELSELSAALEGERYTVDDILLLREERIPDDARCLVIAAPRQALSPYELRLIDDYLAKGGNVLLMLEPYRDAGLADFLGQLGIGLRMDTIIDERSKIMGGDFLFPLVSDYGSHAITRSINVVSFYPIARSLIIEQDLPEGVDIRPIAVTGRETWSESDFEALSKGETAFQEGEDTQGPLTLAAALTMERESGGSEGRMVIFGDSDFAGNDYFSVAGNRDLVLNSIAWLASEPSLIGIRSRDPNHTPIILTQRQTNLVFWLFIVLLPLLSAVAGVLVWFRVRWKQ
jgi:gliding motility-associatede transport system auxiliary component